ncbi:cytosolic enolase 3-like [Vigna unguiculata]|uniref:phosphopyruvate hydratase n=1 Tax=Vigna unguiculata TaxID=3917 RepID=A0A4D6N949_VIGUN|nr:cytosolic enolase 3-like [Vigna unguiculata]QCE10363.1 enolase [Vigna unguiculata]
MYSLLGKERGSCSSLKGELGATTILVVSIAACKVGATKKKVPLYKHITDLSGKTNPTLLIPAFTVISGGKHVGSTMAIQKIMVLPIGASKFEEGLRRY